MLMNFHVEIKDRPRKLQDKNEGVPTLNVTEYYHVTRAVLPILSEFGYK